MDSNNMSKEEFGKYLEDMKEIERIMNIPRIVTPQDRYNILKRQKWICNICGEKLKWNKDSKFGNKVAHIDHIHPFSKRDTYPNGIENINELTNLQALCPKCNLTKGKKEVN